MALTKELLRLVENIAKKYYKKHKKCLSSYLAEEDLVQESYLIVYKTVNSLLSKFLPLATPLFVQAVIWHLNKILERAFYFNKFFISFTNLMPNENGEQTQEEIVDILKVKKDSPSPQILFIMLKKYLTQEEFNLLSKRFIEDKSITEIAKEYNISKQAISEKINRILKKILKKLEKNTLLLSR